MNDAIQAVKNGQSALQASRQFNVPSRTLYDKVKKMGIAGTRPMNRSSIKRSPSNGSSPAAFPYGISGTRSPIAHMEGHSHSQMLNDSENGNEMEQRDGFAMGRFQGMLDPSLLLKAIGHSNDIASHVASLAAANGLTKLGRPMSPSSPPVYEGSSTAAPNSPPRSLREDEDDDDEEPR